MLVGGNASAPRQGLPQIHDCPIPSRARHCPVAHSLVCGHNSAFVVAWGFRIMTPVSWSSVVADTFPSSINWFINRDGQQAGPVTSQEMAKLVEFGHLRPTDYVWREDLDDWKPAASLPELFQQKPAVAPPPFRHVPSAMPNIQLPPQASAPASATPAGTEKDQEASRPFRDPTRLTKVLQVLLYAGIFASVLSIISCVMQFGLRIPGKPATCSGAWRPPVPADDGQRVVQVVQGTVGSIGKCQCSLAGSRIGC